MTADTLLQFTNLWHDLQAVHLNPDQQDSISWRWTANGVYSAASANRILFAANIKHDFAKMAWNSEAPPKCQFFVWLEIQGRCLTADNLAKHGWPHNSTCLLCQQTPEPETAMHILASCPFTQGLWLRVLDLLMMPSDMAPLPTDDTLLGWMTRTSGRLRKDAKKTWRSISALIWWSLWKERNARVFSQQASTIGQVLSNIQEEAKIWIDAGRCRVIALIERPREPD